MMQVEWNLLCVTRVSKIVMTSLGTCASLTANVATGGTQRECVRKNFTASSVVDES